jgi:MraZ protein
LALDTRETFAGGGLQAIDLKSRVAIPVDLRRQLERNGASREIYVDVDKEGDCLNAYDAGWLGYLHDEMRAEHRRLRERNEASDLVRMRRELAPVGEPVSVDGSGRFVIPAFLKGEGRLDKWSYFTGCLDYIEIWNPFDLLRSDRVDERLKRRVRYELTEKGVAF